jgi:hypothetical protein
MNEKEPAVVGVPLMTPLEELRERPAGNAPLVRAQVMGVDPELVKVCAYGSPTVPADSGEVVVMFGGEEAVARLTISAAERARGKM